MEDENVERFVAIEKRMETLELAHGSLSRQIDDNTQTTDAIKRDTGELVKLFAGMTALWKLLDWCGRVAGKFTAIALAIGVVLAVMKFIVLDWMRSK